MEANFQEVSLPEIIRHWVDGYDIPDKEIYDYDYYIDTNKDKVVIKLYTKDESP